MKPILPPPLLPLPTARPARGRIAPIIQEPAGFSPPSRPGPPPSESVDRRLRQLLRMKLERERDAFRLYEPVPGAVEFHASLAKTVLACGSNRSGKTQAIAWEVIARMTGRKPGYQTRKGGEKVYMLGRDHQHLAEGIWPKIGLPGAFKIIKDERTGRWRPVRPDAEYDVAYREKWRDAPPLVTDRMLKEPVAWEDKKAGVPRRFTLKNGSRMSFYVANSAPRRGFSISGAWPDEECENEEWIYELYRGLTDMNGWFLYSFTPQSGTHWAKTKWDEATSPFNLAKPPEKRRIAAFKFLIKDNQFISAESKQTILDGITDERQRKVRWEGEFSLDERIVYPEFSRDSHVVKPFFPDQRWNRYLSIDPGITVAAVLFVAVAPDIDEDGKPHPNAGEVHVYDELYLNRCGADAVAERVKARINEDPGGRGDKAFVAFLIDGRAARQTQMGSGRTIMRDYEEAFRKRGIRSRMTASSFLPGKDVVEVREEALHRMLQVPPNREDSPLKVHSRATGLIWEFPLQTRKKDRKSGLVMKERERRDDHAVTTLEYFCDYNPPWMYFPPPRPEGHDRVLKLFLKKKKRNEEGEPIVRLAPG